jgi:hypothetical protein
MRRQTPSTIGRKKRVALTVRREAVASAPGLSLEEEMRSLCRTSCTLAVPFQSPIASAPLDTWFGTGSPALPHHSPTTHPGLPHCSPTGALHNNNNNNNNKTASPTL